MRVEGINKTIKVSGGRLARKMLVERDNDIQTMLQDFPGTYFSKIDSLKSKNELVNGW